MRVLVLRIVGGHVAFVLRAFARLAHYCLMMRMGLTVLRPSYTTHTEDRTSRSRSRSKRSSSRRRRRKSSTNNFRLAPHDTVTPQEHLGRDTPAPEPAALPS